MSIHGYIMYSIPSIAVLVGRKRIEILVCCVKALSYIEKKTNNRSIGSNSEKIYGERRKRFPFLHSNSERDIANLNFPRPKCVLYQLEMRAIHSFVRLFGLHASCHLIRGMAIRMGWMNTKKNANT